MLLLRRNYCRFVNNSARHLLVMTYLMIQSVTKFKGSTYNLLLLVIEILK
jgi:hypothetical protein